MCSYFVWKIEHNLMSYCLKHKGKWWANHFFRNKEVNNLYAKLRGQDISTVRAIFKDNSSDYKKHIKLGNQIKELIEK